MNTRTSSTPDIGDSAERAAHRTDDALAATKLSMSHAGHSLQSGIDGLRRTVPGAVSRAVAGAEDLARRSAAAVENRAVATGDATLRQIRERPIAAVMVAAATAVATMMLLRWLWHSRGQD